MGSNPTRATMNKTIVNAEEVRALKEQLREINNIPLEDIEWHEDGKPLDINPEFIKEWRFIGMNNSDFIDTGFYKEGWQEIE